MVLTPLEKHMTRMVSNLNGGETIEEADDYANRTKFLVSVVISGENLLKKSCRAITINKRQPRLIGD